MRKKNTWIVYFLVVLTSLCLALSGCNSQNNNQNPLAVDDSINANRIAGPITFKLLMPDSNASGQLSAASIRSNSSIEPTVTFKLVLVNIGNSGIPTSTLIKKVPINTLSGTAETTFSNVPAGPCIGDIHIEGGNIDCQTDFRGATDLVVGNQNTIYVAPKGSRLQQDFVAHVIEQIVLSPALFGKALPNLSNQVTQAISQLDKSLATAYDDAVALFAKSTNVVISVAKIPSISSISPVNGDLQSIITISGLNFGNVQGNSYITYAGFNLAVQSWSDSQITVKLSESMPEQGKFVVTIEGNPSNESATFTLNNKLVITSLSPSSGNPGTVVTISGQGFGTSQVQGAYVTFYDLAQQSNYLTAAVSNWTDTSITCTVPTSLTLSQSSSGQVGVTVWKSSSTYVSSTFNLILPQISFIDPTADNIGATVSINGQGFGSSQNTSYVRIGGSSAPVVSWSDSQVRVRVPDFNTAGQKTIEMTINNRTISNTNFSVAGPENVQGYYPAGQTNIGQGETFTIAGRHFGAAADFDGSYGYTRSIQVTASGNLYSVSSVNWSDTQITFSWPVPNSIINKTAAVTINIGGLSATISNIQAK